MGFSRVLRTVSEKQLMTAAQRTIARRYGTRPPLPPHGLDLFWQKVYVPAYHALPWRLRARVMARMPGSHRETWHQPAQPRGPAV